MFRRGNLGSVLMTSFLAEVVVFALVAERIGFGDTLLLTLASSLFGAAILRRQGTSALARLRELSGQNLAGEGALVDGMLGGLGALLLILPGFISDLVGLVLIAPSGRQWLMRRLGVNALVPARRPNTGSETIDLGADDWTRLDNMRSR